MCTRGLLSIFTAFCALWLACASGLACASADAAASGSSAATTAITAALSVQSNDAHFPDSVPATAVTLPDDWPVSRPDYDGSVWYRTRFATPAADAVTAADPGPRNDLLAIYIERACTNLDVHLNGRRIFSGGNMTEPLTRNCYRPQLISLPAALLAADTNVLDIRVIGSALPHVTARARAGGLSALVVGPESEMAALYTQHQFWNVTAGQITAITLIALGGFLLTLAWINRSEIYLLYFGALLVSWALLSMRVWWTHWPFDTRQFEVLVATVFPVVVALSVQFLLTYAGTRSRRVAGALLLQCVLLPLTLVAAPADRLAVVADAWFVLMAAELLAAIAVYLRLAWQRQRRDFWPMGLTLAAVGVLVVVELALQLGWLTPLPVQPLNFALPLLLMGIGSRLLQVFGRALQAAEVNRAQLETRVMEATAEIERNFTQMSALRVEQVTEKERKRIAADLHDDLGAKLLTIVHTSESERISTLAREALEEMRLSVRGLTGRPVLLADALADWRAETVLRLGQANIDADWRNPLEDIDQTLSARVFVQTTRILREAVSNIIKHSQASQCKVRISVNAEHFGLLVQDNGKGIPMQLDGKLDRGHGMSSMKHRAKQLQGQCLVESGQGFGTVIRLTIPL
jgi:two-component system, NarL family, sensor histidine kinase UhpB